MALLSLGLIVDVVFVPFSLEWNTFGFFVPLGVLLL